MNPEIEKYIILAKEEGGITTAQKNIILSKARQLGIDTDEIAFLLEGIPLRDTSQEGSKDMSVKKSHIENGDTRKCPRCGAIFGSFQMTCPECGYDFINEGPNKFVERFAKELSFQTNGINNKQALAKAESICVRNYPMPMTKEDCIEMLNFILPNTAITGATVATIAWREKFDAILQKLERECNHNHELTNLISKYKSQTKVSIFGKMYLWYKCLPTVFRIIIGYNVICVGIALISMIIFGLIMLI